jgi:hypothetical protein
VGVRPDSAAGKVFAVAALDTLFAAFAGQGNDQTLLAHLGAAAGARMWAAKEREQLTAALAPILVVQVVQGIVQEDGGS